MRYGQHPEYETFRQRDHRLFHENQQVYGNRARGASQIPAGVRVLEPGVDYLVRWGIDLAGDRPSQPAGGSH